MMMMYMATDGQGWTFNQYVRKEALAEFKTANVIFPGNWTLEDKFNQLFQANNSSRWNVQ